MGLLRDKSRFNSSAQSPLDPRARATLILFQTSGGYTELQCGFYRCNVNKRGSNHKSMTLDMYISIPIGRLTDA